MKFNKNSKNFFVEEINPQLGVIELSKKYDWKGEGDYCCFVVEKENWNTIDLAKKMCRMLNVSKKRINYAGMKDRQAKTTQIMSAWKVDPEIISKINLPDVKINGAWKCQNEVKMGDLIGNRFKIFVDIEKSCEKEVYDIFEKNGGVMPNYFGEQRFGILNNTHIVGEKIIEGDFEGAVKEYICGGERDLEKRREAKEAREKTYENWGNFKNALDYFPKYLRYERVLLSHLSEYPHDYIGALRHLPRKLSLLFIHSYQSNKFNHELRSRYEKYGQKIIEDDRVVETNEFGFPDLKKEVENKYINQKVSIKNKIYPVGNIPGYLTGDERFKIKSFPEISSKGSMRCLYVPLINFKYFEEGERGIFQFDLPSGSYATVALDLFLRE